jgi:ElaB/YqjD/DUF883 family membrane-anchored ribosome-binding protein
MNSTDDQTTIRSFPSYPDYRNPEPPMNSPQDIIAPVVDQAAEQIQQAQEKARSRIREHPLGIVFVAVGVGLAAGLVLKLLATPPPPPTARQRIQRTLDDIQSRLTDLAQPYYKRATEFAGTGAEAVKKGLDQVQDMHLERKLNGVLNRLKGLFS